MKYGELKITFNYRWKVWLKGNKWTIQESKLTWCFTDDNSLPGTYVAFSLQSGIAKSWHSTCAKYSHTTKKQLKNKNND